jgi:hypothetical protein
MGFKSVRLAGSESLYRNQTESETRYMTTLATRPRVEGGFDLKRAFHRYAEILALNTVRLGGPNRLDNQTLAQKRAVAMEAASFYRNEIDPHFNEFADIPMREIMGSDNADVNLGTLTGTLVIQRSLPLFKFNFPILSTLYSDFSATAGVFNQTEVTRIVVVPAVQLYDGTAGIDGRPKGFANVQPAVTLDAPIKLDSYIGIPIVFSSGILAATIRRLFDEEGPAAVYAMAKYYVGKLTALLTPANFNSYAEVSAPDAQGVVKVPAAYPTYPISRKNFSMDAIDDIEAIFDQNEVPTQDRGILLNANYYGRLRSDPRLALFFAAVREPGIIEQGKLPASLDGFVPVRAPWLPSTNNLVGFAYQKAAILLKQRLPTDFTEALGVMIPGSVTTIVDPESGLSCLLVQYVNLQQNYAEWRLETLLGASVGDKRGGLAITSQ